MLNLFVLSQNTGERVDAYISPASQTDFKSTVDWQTSWESAYISRLPNKVALKREDNDELLGLMSYKVEKRMLAVEILYVESAAHSNANLLHETGKTKKYVGIGKALFAYAAKVSIDAGCDGVLLFKAKDSELLEYYLREFGARQLGSYDPFRLAIWEDAAQELLREYTQEV